MDLCFLVVLIVSIAVLAFGLMDALKKRQSNESNDATLQRQLRGFAMIVLANVIFVIGAGVCAEPTLKGLLGGAGSSLRYGR